jgi:hypothetical protein
MNASIRFENGAAWIDLDGQRHLPVAYRSFRLRPKQSGASPTGASPFTASSLPVSSVH